MQIKVVYTSDNPNIVAVTYGVVILAGKMGNEGMVAYSILYCTMTIIFITIMYVPGF
ncbi:hypothetical protein [Flavobacterium cheongpyeongense]|uniref:hypothetical protein n=1 Tax=Flavobacterium cheongpyeongense TaxID=2212651 RepID=UPI001402B24A|nr:hypothetical protein [Flavobacterium cheongpyeongense]